ncbi:Holliday junction ATP-dependent DNA helicase RuvB [Rosistilla oblonga]|nr:Holliday junction ATP-dependent DNA helicase RuvB [Rosistilla oblonga]
MDATDPSVQPTSLSHLVGQDEVKAAIDIGLSFAFQKNEPFPSPTLLLGPSSAGKSIFSSVIAAELCVDCKEVLAQTINSAAELNALLLACNEKTIVTLDEAHLLSPALQTLLYSVIDKNTVYVPTGGRQPQPIKLPPLTILLATTDPQNLLPPLRNRAALELNFRLYTFQEIAQIVYRRAKSLAWDVHEAVLPLIADRSKQEPRRALKLLQSAYRVAIATGSDTIDLRHLEETCRIQQLDSLGLNRAEQDYLNVLMDAPSRLNVLASRLAVGIGVIRDLEGVLVRLGLIGKDSKGIRELTAEGRKHVQSNCK